MAKRTVYSTVSITANNIGKRYRYEWIFRGVNYTFETGTWYAILGGNGSGKSTLLQILAGSLMPSTGALSLRLANRVLEVEEWYRYLSWVAPSVELIEEFTLTELIDFQAKFKQFSPDFTTEQIIDFAQLAHARHKEFRYFSSGMKQRAKLALAFLSQTPILLLDEPTTNLDTKGIDWYKQLVQTFADNRLLIVASNQQQEYDFCTARLQIEDFKATR